MKNTFGTFIILLLTTGCLLAQNFWQATQNNQLSPPVSSLVCDSTETVFAGTDNIHVFKTTDRGDHWSGISIAQGVGATQALAVDSNGYLLAASGNVLYRSTNGGTTWNVLNGAMGNYIFSIIVDAQNIIYVGVHDGGVLRSTDGGSTWAPANNGDNNPDDALAFATGMGALFSATSNGIYRTVDHGGSWTSVNGNLNAYVSQIAVNAFNKNGILCAGTDSGIYISINGGASWSVTHNGLPTGISTQEIISDQRGNFYIATIGTGVYRSSDNGTTWSAINSGLNNLNAYALTINDQGFLYAATDSGVFRSEASVTSDVKESETIPEENIITTFSSYPNPSSSPTVLSYALNAPAPVTLTVSDILGRTVAALVKNEIQGAGIHSIEFNAAGLGAGTFIGVLKVGAASKALRIDVTK